MTTYQIQYNLLQKAFWSNKDFKEFFEVSMPVAIRLKKEVLQHCKDNGIRLYNEYKMPTEEIVKHFNINVNYIKRNK